ncbi:trypsin-like peptidase domain-containing protein [Candidatus Parcubacteria bacterium]|nr:trypsin-like peptidase domain-containing protein [Candidatus Parcubacteria bacterium]
MRWYQILIFSFFFGIFGGIFGTQILWPYFVERPLFFQYQLDKIPTHITKIEQKTLVVQENTALKEAIDKIKKTIFFVKTELKNKKIEGSGFFLTNDCLGITLSDLVPKDSNTAFYFENSPLSFQVIKRDPGQNLVLIKFEREKCETAPFFDFEKLKLGERVFALSFFRSQHLVEEGIVKFFDQNLILTSISNDSHFAGSPLFDIEGKFLGLNFIQENQVFTIPAPKIKNFAGI